jgi:hypothetical protein
MISDPTLAGRIGNYTFSLDNSLDDKQLLV